MPRGLHPNSIAQLRKYHKRGSRKLPPRYNLKDFKESDFRVNVIPLLKDLQGWKVLDEQLDACMNVAKGSTSVLRRGKIKRLSIERYLLIKAIHEYVKDTIIASVAKLD